MWQGWESFLRFCNIRKHSLGARINALVEETPESSLTPSTRWPSMSQKTGWAKKQIPGHWICWHFYHGLESLAEKAMAPHSSTLAWKIPWTEEPGGLQSMGLLRVGHDWATSLSLFTFMHWRRKWQPTPAFLPAESQGWGSLVGCRLWGRTESDTTEVT